MMYSDDKYVHVLTMLERWESETPTQGFDFGITEITNKENPKGRRIRKM